MIADRHVFVVWQERIVRTEQLADILRVLDAGVEIRVVADNRRQMRTIRRTCKANRDTAAWRRAWRPEHAVRQVLDREVRMSVGGCDPAPQLGMPRSASTWSFNVVVAILRAADPSAGIHARYNEDPSRFLAEAPTRCHHAVLKCHSLPPSLRAQAASGEAKIVFTTRDIADAIASFMAMFGSNFAHALAVMDGALDHLAFHRRSGHALILHYADIIANSAREVARIADYLSIRLSPTVTGDITEEMSLPRMRAKVPPSDGSENARHLIRHETTLYDPETLLNVGHILDGRTGGGRRTLNAGQLAQVAALLGRYGMAMPQPDA